MKRILLILLVALIGIPVQAQEKKSKNAKHEVEVYGNCEICKKRIEKAAYSVPGVKSAAWHQDHKDLHLIIDENKCSVEDVQKAVAKSGHDTEGVKAKDEDYDKLHACCKYDRG